MKFTIRKTSLTNILRAIESGKQSDTRDSLIRVSASNGTVTMNANDVEGGCDAEVTEEGVCFFQYERFLPLIKKYPYVRALNIEVTPDGIQIGDTKISRGLWEVSLFSNPLTAPKQLRGTVDAINLRRAKVNIRTGQQDGEEPNFVLVALDAAERTLAKQVDEEEVRSNKPAYASNAKDCDLCQRPLIEMGLIVDGKLRGQPTWATMCAACFLENGGKVAWGTAQVYARQPNAEWRLVAGFPSEDDPDFDLFA